MFKKFGKRFGGAVLAAALIQPLASGAFAAEPQAQIGNTTYNELWQALEAVQDGQTIEILRDITNQEVLLSRDCNTAFSITIDLNGHTISESTSNSPAFTYLSSNGSIAPTVKIQDGTLTCTSKSSVGSPFSSGIWVESLDKKCRPVLILQNITVKSQNDAGINCIDAQLQVVSGNISGYDDAVYAQDAPVYVQAGRFSILDGTDQGKNGAISLNRSSMETTGANPIIQPENWKESHSTQVEITCFEDVPNGSWFYDTVYTLARQKLISGVNCWTFNPNKDITRSELIAMLARASGEDISNYSSTYFIDINESDWYNTYIGWAVYNGIATGYNTGYFGPNDTITREQIAVMLLNYQAHMGNQSPENIVQQEKFLDESQISSWAKTAMMTIVEEGIIYGTQQKDGTILLMPQENATRAQACVMMYNIMNLT